jgi:hypothetical protein
MDGHHEVYASILDESSFLPSKLIAVYLPSRDGSIRALLGLNATVLFDTF